MRESLRDLIRRVVSGSILMTGASTPAVAATPVEHPALELPLASSEVRSRAEPGEMVIRERRPRLVLRRTEEATLTLVSSHRSHRSHSSHRSHYSSSGGGSYGSYPRSTPRSTPRRSSPPPAPAYCVPSYGEFGSRVLQRGMCGADVRELMRLLVRHGHLDSSDVNSDSSFTLTVQNAVKAFQRSRRLKADGIVGAMTARRLQEES